MRFNGQSSQSESVYVYELQFLACNCAPSTSKSYPQTQYSYYSTYEQVSITPIVLVSMVVVCLLAFFQVWQWMPIPVPFLEYQLLPLYRHPIRLHQQWEQLHFRHQRVLHSLSVLEHSIRLFELTRPVLRMSISEFVIHQMITLCMRFNQAILILPVKIGLIISVSMLIDLMSPLIPHLPIGHLVHIITCILCCLMVKKR